MGATRRWNAIRVIITTVNLLVGWLLFTWSLLPGSLIMGLVMSLAVAILTFPIFVEEGEASRRAQLPHVYLFGLYIVVLIFQMYVSSFRVMWLIIRGRTNPGVVHFRTRLKSDISRLMLSNAITLTPGTLTLLLDDDHLVVHWLDARTTHSKYAHKLIARPFEVILKRIWG